LSLSGQLIILILNVKKYQADRIRKKPSHGSDIQSNKEPQTKIILDCERKQIER
jgi:hypothetical protein